MGLTLTIPAHTIQLFREPVWIFVYCWTFAVTFEPTGHYLWVTNLGSDSISIIDSRTNAVTKTVMTTPASTSLWESYDGFVQTTPK